MNVPHPLWLRFKQGDSDAFEQLYQENLDGLLRYGHHFTPQTELIEDVIQELFVDLWQRKANLGDTDSPRKYLCASLRHRLYRTLKKNAKTASEDEIPFDMSWDWEDAPSSEERYAQVESALEQLSHREKKPFICDTTRDYLMKKSVTSWAFNISRYGIRFTGPSKN